MSDADFQPSALADVAYRKDGDRWTLVLTRLLRHPPEKVWAALTDPAQVGAWAPFTADRDLGRPGELTLTMLDGQAREELPASVIRAEPSRLLEYTWGGDLLRWELTPLEAGTQLRLEHTVSDRELVPKVAAGWHLCLDVAEQLLDGRPIEPIRGEDAINYGWAELHDAYSDRLDL